MTLPKIHLQRHGFAGPAKRLVLGILERRGNPPDRISHVYGKRSLHCQTNLVTSGLLRGFFVLPIGAAVRRASVLERELQAKRALQIPAGGSYRFDGDGTF
jgi:hypothetical protein